MSDVHVSNSNAIRSCNIISGASYNPTCLLNENGVHTKGQITTHEYRSPKALVILVQWCIITLIARCHAKSKNEKVSLRQWPVWAPDLLARYWSRVGAYVSGTNYARFRMTILAVKQPLTRMRAIHSKNVQMMMT